MTAPREDFEFIELGNTYSEYRCRHCGGNVIVNMEDMDEAVLDAHRHDCGRAPMSDVKRFNFNARDADGSIPLYVRAADYDALQAENAALRTVLRIFIDRTLCNCNHCSALKDRARALLGENA
jgi:predicted nucleic acid-binding Zn ribbon protein